MTSVPQLVAIVGASGKVGYATATALRQAGVPVRAILRDASKAPKLTEAGCDIALADLQDPESLAKAISGADVVQIILPPPIQTKDTTADMLKMIENLASALEEALPQRVLAISDYGAHVLHDIGMPTVFRLFEERLARLGGHKLFLRSAPHMETWGRSIPAAIASGTLRSFHNPASLLMPTISAPDLGRISASLLLRQASDGGVQVFHAEGPRRYSANDVATALSELLNRSIVAEVVPRSHWREALEQVMNPSFAELLIKANDAQNKGALVDVEPNVGEIIHGTTDLIDALRVLLPKPKI
jgi:uncharacterized protein YbjT (DUF2867 family)